MQTTLRVESYWLSYYLTVYNIWTVEDLSSIIWTYIYKTVLNVLHKPNGGMTGPDSCGLSSTEMFEYLWIFICTPTNNIILSIFRRLNLLPYL